VDEGEEMGSSEEAAMRCQWCGKGMPEGKEVCPHCKRSVVGELRAMGDGLAPLGGPVEAPGRGEPPRPQRDPAPQVRDPRVERERKRAREAVEAERWRRLSYFGYLKAIVGEDQVFGVLLGLMAVQVVVAAMGVVRVAAEGGWWHVPGMFLLGYLVMLGGILTLQRWAHTVVVWLAGVSLIGAALGLLWMFLAPLRVHSGMALTGMWFSWVFRVASAVFVLVVLCERTAYFEGVEARVQPKRRALADLLKRGYWEKAGKGQEPPASMAPRRADTQSHPSTYAGPHGGPRSSGAPESSIPRSGGPTEEAVEGAKPTEAEGLRPLGGAPTAAPQRPRMPRPGESKDPYHVEPLPPAPGQREGVDWQGMRAVLSWHNISDLARRDRLFGVLLGVLALQVVVMAVNMNVWATFGAVALFWGVLTRQQWGYWMAFGLAVLQTLVHVALFAAAFGTGSALGLWYYALIVGINVFVIVALVRRAGQFG